MRSLSIVNSPATAAAAAAEDIWRRIAVSIPRVRDGPRLGSTDPPTYLIGAVAAAVLMRAGDEWRQRRCRPSMMPRRAIDVMSWLVEHTAALAPQPSLQLDNRHEFNAILLMKIYSPYDGSIIQNRTIDVK